MAFDEKRQLFDHSAWRQGNAERRELARELVRQCIEDDDSLTLVIERFKRHAGWFRLDDRDRNRLNVLFTAIRKIVWGWALISLKDRSAFLAGDLPASTLAKIVDEAERRSL